MVQYLSPRLYTHSYASFFHQKSTTPTLDQAESSGSTDRRAHHPAFMLIRRIKLWHDPTLSYGVEQKIISLAVGTLLCILCKHAQKLRFDQYREPRRYLHSLVACGPDRRIEIYSYGAFFYPIVVQESGYILGIPSLLKSQA